MITFNDVPLLLEDLDGKVGRQIERLLGSWPDYVLNPPRRTIDSKSRIQLPKWGPTPRLKPNQFYNPTGATRWAVFFGLATDEQYYDIIHPMQGQYDQSSAGTLSIGAPWLNPDDPTGAAVSVNVTSGNSIDGTFNLHANISARMWLLAPIPVAEEQQDQRTLWILPFVDVRYWWQQQVVVGPNTNTWWSLIADLTGAVESDVVADDSSAISDALGVPDNCFFGNGAINAAAALDMVCWACNLRLVWLPTPGKYVLRSKTTAVPIYNSSLAAQQTTAAGQWLLGGDWSGTDGSTPNNTQLIFTNDTANSLYTWDAVDQGFSIPTNAYGAAAQWWSPWYYDPDHLVEANNFANQWMGDWYRWTNSLFWWSFPGLLDWHSSGFEDYVLCDMSRRGNGSYSAHTIVRSLPTWKPWDVIPCQRHGVTRSCGNGETCRTVRFRINAPLAGTLSCICSVEAVDVGFTLQDVPDRFDIEVLSVADAYLPPEHFTMILVCDPLCTFFNEPPDALNGRRGWARYMQPLVVNSCQTDGYDLVPQWEVFSLNCLLNPICS